MDHSIVEAVDGLCEWCHAMHLPWHASAADQFGLYISLLIHAQKQTNLTGFSTPASIVASLFVDSLQILRVKMPTISIVDIGTGAGFPGIPIKILLPETATILVEPRTKRYAFLRLVERELGLDSIEIHKCRMESLVLKQVPEMVISKAFAPLPQWLELVKPWASQGAEVGCLASQKDWATLNLTQLGYKHAGSIEENQRVYAVVKAL